MINEPTAAALAYGLHKVDVVNVLVVDLGGGTLDVSLLHKQGGMFLTRAMAGSPPPAPPREPQLVLKLRLCAGNNQLGGQDFSQRLLHHATEQVRQRFGSAPTLAEDLHRLRQAVEEAKIQLTFQPSATLSVPLQLQAGGSAPVLFQSVITRRSFEQINEDLFQKILAPVETVLADGHLQKEDVDEVVLVGGSTRIPRIRSLISQYFGKEPNTSVDPDLAVVMGVAIQAGIMGGSWPLQVSALEIPNRHLRKTDHR